MDDVEVEQRPPSPSPAPDRPHPESVWVRTVVGWHVAFGLIVVVCAVGVLAAPDARPADRPVSLAALAAVGVAYALLTRRHPARQRGDTFAYLGVLCVGTALVIAFGPGVGFFLFIAYPQVWLLTDHVRDGVLWTVLLTASATVGFLARSGPTWDALRDIGVEMLVSLSFSLLLGIWISRVIAQSQQRADLIAELGTTRAQLGAAHHAAGVVAERERVAREIHDTLAQGFTSVIALVQAERARLAAAGDDAPRLALLEDTARENLVEARALVAAYSCVDLDGVGLTGALTRLAERFTAESGVPVDLRLPGTPADREVDTAGAVVLLRVAQEALANVRQHARAQHVTLRLTADADLSIEVVDDGAGFDAETGSSRFGLSGMRHRVEEAGGRLAVRSAPGAGTRVTASLP